MIFLSKFLPFFVFPVGLTLELGLAAALFFHFRKFKSGFGCLGGAAAILLFFSLQVPADALMRGLERRHSPVEPGSVQGDAIVVLGGGLYAKIFPRRTPEVCEGGDRVIEAVRQFKAGAAPRVITTGGAIEFIQRGHREGDDMRDLLVEFGVPAEAVSAESESRNTHENAVAVRSIVEKMGWGKKILLVTSAAHMPRSAAIFRKAGFEVAPVPTDYVAPDRSYTWYYWLPNAFTLQMSTAAIREYIGIAVYWLKGWL